MRFDGTKGTLVGELSATDSEIVVSDHLSGTKESIDLETKYDESQHGGGDSEMLLDIVNNLKKKSSKLFSRLVQSPSTRSTNTTYVAININAKKIGYFFLLIFIF